MQSTADGQADSNKQADNDSQSADDSQSTDDQEAVDSQDQPDQAPPEGQYSIKITATGADVYLNVVADGEVVYDGWLGDGGSTDWFTAAQFSIYTSDGAATLFTNDRGEPFYMGDEADVTYSLP
jgi:hypothetical protein